MVKCSGCDHLQFEVSERRRLAAELARVGQTRLAGIALEGIGSIRQDWEGHIRRDHPDFRAPLVLAEPAAVEAETEAAVCV